MASPEGARPPRRVGVHITPCIDPSAYTWLQYHTPLVVSQRNRLAQLRLPQLLTYANLHFSQVITFEQVELQSLPLRDQSIALNKAINIAARDMLKTKNKRYSLARIGVDGDLVDDSEKGGKAAEDDSADSQSVVSDSSDSGSVVGLKKIPGVSHVLHPDNSLAASDSSGSLVSSPSAVLLPTFPSQGIIYAEEEQSQQPEQEHKQQPAEQKEALKEHLEAEEKAPRVDRDDFDNDAMLESFAAKPGVHIMDASLNRIRQLNRMHEISQWNVACILFLNLSGNLLVSLDGIDCCRNLRVLDCSDNILTHLSPLRGCLLLKRLRINGNKVVTVSLSDPITSTAIGSLTTGGDESAPVPTATVTWFELEYLELNDNLLDPIDGLTGLPGFGQRLTHLEMRNCNLSTSAFAQLAGLADLESLHADNNLFDDLASMVPILQSMPRLRHLSLLGNPVAKSAASASAPLQPAADAKSSSSAPPPQQRAKYAITIFDNVSTLKSFDHLAVPAGLYIDLARLKGQVKGEEILDDVSSRYSKEIVGISRVHENLVERHRIDEEMVEQAVRRQAQRLEEELEELLVFGREKLAQLRPKHAEEHETAESPESILAAMANKRAEMTIYQPK